MEKFAVFTESTRELIQTHELSVSNNIISREPIDVVFNIVNEWVKSIIPSARVFMPKNGKSVDDFTIVDASYYLSVIHKECNVRFIILNVKYTTNYVTRKVK